jgi:hypothetical protein
MSSSKLSQRELKRMLSAPLLVAIPLLFAMFFSACGDICILGSLGLSSHNLYSHVAFTSRQTVEKSPQVQPIAQLNPQAIEVFAAGEIEHGHP